MAVDTMLVSITDVNLINRTMVAWSPMSGQVPVRMDVMPSGNFFIPAKGEQWIIKKNANAWYLDERTIFQDARANLPAVEGLSAYGSSGPTYVMGKTVHLPSSFYIGEYEARINDIGIMEVRHGETWTPVDNGGVGAITKADVGLGNVDNTSDSAKPLSNASLTALSNKSNINHTHTPAEVGATTVGASLMTATTQAAARTAIGAGTSNLTLGTSPSTAALGSHTHTAGAVGAVEAGGTAAGLFLGTSLPATGQTGWIYVVTG